MLPPDLKSLPYRRPSKRKLGPISALIATFSDRFLPPIILYGAMILIFVLALALDGLLGVP